MGDRGRIVLYGETLPVTRLFFTLDYLGLGELVSVLDGGLAAWRATGGSVTAEPTPVPTRTTLVLTPQPELLADAQWVNARRRLLGYQVRLPDGSMNEWAGRPELPVATGAPAPP